MKSNRLVQVVAGFVFLLAMEGQAQAASDTASLSGDEVLANWRDQTITVRDFELDMERIPEKDRFEYRLDQARIYKSLDNMMVRRALSEEARALGLEKDPRVLAELAYARESILARARVQAFQKALPAVEMGKAAEEYYKTNQKEFARPEKINASHVLIDTKSRTPEEAEKRAEEVRQKAVAGADFGALAAEYSDEPGAKQRRGSLGFFTKGKMVKEFENAAFALKMNGEISQVIKTRFGYHVIRLDGREAESVAPYAEVKDAIEKKLRAKYENEQLKSYIDSLRGDKSVVMHADTIEKLKSTLPPEVKIQLQQRK